MPLMAPQLLKVASTSRWIDPVTDVTRYFRYSNRTRRLPSLWLERPAPNMEVAPGTPRSDSRAASPEVELRVHQRPRRGRHSQRPEGDNGSLMPPGQPMSDRPGQCR
jgi:hypothetical protein